MNKIFFFLLFFISSNYNLLIAQNNPKSMSYESGIKLRSIYIYQFALNYSWPTLYTKENFIIGIYKNKDIYKFSNSNKDKFKGDQKIFYQFYETIDDIDDCHLLFVPNDLELHKVKEKINRLKTLLVGENCDPSLVDISFLEIDNRLKFIVNQNLESRGFIIGQTMTKLAYNILSIEEYTNALNYIKSKLKNQKDVEVVINTNTLNKIYDEFQYKEEKIDSISIEIENKLLEIKNLEEKQKQFNKELFLKEKEITLKNNEVKVKLKEVKVLKNKQIEFQKLINQKVKELELNTKMITQKTKELKDLEIELEYKQNEISSKTKTIAINNKEISEKSKKIQDQNKIQNLTNFILFLVVVFLAFSIFIFLKVRKSRNLISSQKSDLEIKTKEIEDSISYAKRIQTAILPSSKIVRQYLKDSFIYYLPKDIVAGDFYWMETVGKKTLFAAADCTGHGVPGAMVSVICNSCLNKSVLEFNLTDPGEILDKTRELVLKEFEKSEEEINDGMDIAICSLEEKKEGYELKFSGAYNPLWLIRDGVITDVKGNRQPIGKSDKKDNFKTEIFQLNKGDSFYIFSDGYVDQFGGEKGKKYKSAQFKKFLLTINDNPMEMQKELIAQNFDQWRGNYEQIDDVCVIGVKV